MIAILDILVEPYAPRPRPFIRVIRESKIVNRVKTALRRQRDKTVHSVKGNSPDDQPKETPEYMTGTVEKDRRRTGVQHHGRAFGLCIACMGAGGKASNSRDKG